MCNVDWGSEFNWQKRLVPENYISSGLKTYSNKKMSKELWITVILVFLKDKDGTRNAILLSFMLSNA